MLPIFLPNTSTLYLALNPSISPVYPVLNLIVVLEPTEEEKVLKVFSIPLKPFNPLAIVLPSPFSW